MKQYITHQQFEQLSGHQQTKVMKRWTKNMGDLIFCKPERDEQIFFGLITEIRDGKAYSAWNTPTTSSAKMIKESTWYPLFSYGQVVEMVVELYSGRIDLNHKSIDDLWGLLVEKL